MTLLLSALLACPRHRHLNVFAAHRNQVRTCFCPHLLGRKSGISNHGCRNGGGGDDDDDDDDEVNLTCYCYDAVFHFQLDKDVDHDDDEAWF